MAKKTRKSQGLSTSIPETKAREPKPEATPEIHGAKVIRQDVSGVVGDGGAIVPCSRQGSSRLLKVGVAIGLTIVAIVVAQHPPRSPLLNDLISPAERLLREVGAWGNFTVTGKIRDAVREVYATTFAEEQVVQTFYADILNQTSDSTKRHPVFFIPGYITSGLELWQSRPCARAKFRERIWGTTSMVKLFLTNPSCWIDHMRLVPKFGAEESSSGARTVHFSEPEGIRIQPTSGLSAADYVLGEYWVWNPIFEALARAGYDESQMWMMSYDWRLALRDLEYKDRYFSRMSLEIEKLVRLNGERVLIVSHSFGGKVWFFFLQWANEHLTPGWIDEHLHTTYHIAAVFLGVPKAIAATLSGDTRDTAQLGALSTLLDTLLPPSDRSLLCSGWGSIVDMLPMGGSKSWKSPMLVINDEVRNVEQATELLFKTSAMTHHATHRKGDDTALRCPPSASGRNCYRDIWTDPTRAALPKMKNMRIWCVYGIGIPTEVGYHYTAGNRTDNGAYRINTDLHADNGNVVNGVMLDDGDGTVPLESLGAVCSSAWNQDSSLNPGKTPVFVRELVHGENYSVLSRSGAAGGSSVDHVDIMGNRQVIRDILHLALGMDEAMDPPTGELSITRRNISLDVLPIKS